MLRFDMSQLYNGMGVSQGLERGLLVYWDDVLLLEEGMGIGACAFQTGGYTYFTSIKEINKTGDEIETICSIDRRLEIKILGIRTRMATRAQEFIATNVYMKHKISQIPILFLFVFSRKLFHVKSCFVKGPPLGEVRVAYGLEKSGVLVDISCTLEKKGKFFVMNELGGGIFNKSIAGGKLSNPPLGWQKMEGPRELYSSAQSLAFTMEERHVPDNVKSKLCWGREKLLNNCNWAGFESEIVCDSSEFKNYTYSINFREVTK